MTLKLSAKPRNVKRRELAAKEKAEIHAIWLRMQVKKGADLTKARLFYSDQQVECYSDQKLAYQIWLSLRKGIRCAFRGIGDATPVYSHDYADRG